MRKFTKKIMATTLGSLLLLSCLGGCSSDGEDIQASTTTSGISHASGSDGYKVLDNEFLAVSYNTDYFEITENSAKETVFSTELDYSKVMVTSKSRSYEFISGFSNMMMDPDVLSAELYDALFWETIYSFYDLSFVDTEIPSYVVNGMGTQDLNKPVVTCIATFEVESFGNFPALTFKIKMVGAEEKGVLITSIYEEGMSESISAAVDELTENLGVIVYSEDMLLSNGENDEYLAPEIEGAEE